MPFGLWARTGPRNHKLDGVQIPYGKRQFLEKVAPTVEYRDFLLWAMQKRLNRSICCLSCALGWAEGSTSSIVFSRWRQYALMDGHIGATWRIRLNCPSAAAMRPYVKLFWPLVLWSPTLAIYNDTAKLLYFTHDFISLFCNFVSCSSHYVFMQSVYCVFPNHWCVLCCCYIINIYYTVYWIFCKYYTIRSYEHLWCSGAVPTCLYSVLVQW